MPINHCPPGLLTQAKRWPPAAYVKASVLAGEKGCFIVWLRNNIADVAILAAAGMDRGCKDLIKEVQMLNNLLPEVGCAARHHGQAWCLPQSGPE
jgi:hypothetical protein